MKRLIFLLFLCTSSSAHALSDSDRIDALAEFLIDRAEANALYIFEARLKDDKNFQCYFPSTYKKLEVVTLEHLFYSKDIWRQTLEDDINNLAVRALATKIETSLKLSDASVTLASSLTPSLSYFQIEENGKPYPLGVNPLGIDPKLHKLINGFSDPLGDIVVAMNEFRQYNNFCAAPHTTKDQFLKNIEALLDADKKLKIWIDHVDKNKQALRLSAEGEKALCQKLDLAPVQCTEAKTDPANLLKRYVSKKLSVASINSLKTSIENIKKRIEAFDTAYNNVSTITAVPPETFKTITRKVNADGSTETTTSETVSTTSNNSEPKINSTAKATLALELIKETGSLKESAFDNLRTGILFFAQVSDASDKKEVVALLKSYTLPAVGFYEKRKPRHHVLLTSYLGLAAADTNNKPSTDEATNGGLFAPVGLEYSYGTASGNSFSVMLSPIDMGYPINLKLQGIEKKIEFSELVAPSLSLSWGLPKYPLTLGVGYQKGRRYNGINKTEERVLAFIAFDMPLFRLY
jgi:hypothetical protein